MILLLLGYDEVSISFKTKTDIEDVIHSLVCLYTKSPEYFVTMTPCIRLSPPTFPFSFLFDCSIICIHSTMFTYTGWPPQKNKKKKHGTVDFLGLCSAQQLSFFTLLDRPSFPHYNNTKIIIFG